MQPRMNHPVFVLPGTREAIMAVAKLVEASGLDRKVNELVNVRAGQINGCSPCVDMHTRMLEKHGETRQRLYNIATWRETPYYSDAERAALAYAEAATRLCDRAEAIPDAIWKSVAEHFSESALAGLVMTVAMANFWNRLNVPTQQQTGDFVEKYL
jgi:AhpD family alkylhydroperoxidase